MDEKLIKAKFQTFQRKLFYFDECKTRKHVQLRNLDEFEKKCQK